MMGNAPVTAERTMRIMGRTIARGASVPSFPRAGPTAIRSFSLSRHSSRRCSMTSILLVGTGSEQRFFAAGRLLPSVRLHLANQVLLI